VFFNILFEAEPFAAILIAHETHGHSLEFVSGGTREAWMAESGEGVLGDGAAAAKGLGECCKIRSWVSGAKPRLQMHF